VTNKFVFVDIVWTSFRLDEKFSHWLSMGMDINILFYMDFQVCGT